MREEDVPQEGNATLGGHRKAVYASDRGGQIGITASRGWEAEEAVTRQAADECARLAIEAGERARRGTASPLEFHMHRARMDLPLLAQTTGFWQWRIRRHFRPAVFERLSESILRRYAEALGISVDRLRHID